MGTSYASASRTYASGRRPSLTNGAPFSSNVLRVEHRVALDMEIEQAFCRLPVTQIFERLKAIRVANVRLRHVREFFDYPQLGARDY